MPEVTETFIKRWFEEVWNKGREDAIDEMFAKDGIAYGLKSEEGETIHGAENFKALYRSFRSAFPNLKITVEDTVIEGDKIAARCTVRATHAGEGIGVSPTQQTVEFTGMTIVRLKEGQIIEAWNEFDFMKMFTQVGALTFNMK